MSTNGQAVPVGGRTGCSEQVSAIGKMIVESQTLDEDGKEMVSGSYPTCACQTAIGARIHRLLIEATWALCSTSCSIWQLI